jgi:hypothetical protein
MWIPDPISGRTGVIWNPMVWVHVSYVLWPALGGETGETMHKTSSAAGFGIWRGRQAEPIWGGLCERAWNLDLGPRHRFKW